MNVCGPIPDAYRENVRKVSAALCTDEETAFSMMLIAAVMTDLGPNDARVVEMILRDAGNRSVTG